MSETTGGGDLVCRLPVSDGFVGGPLPGTMAHACCEAEIMAVGERQEFLLVLSERKGNSQKLSVPLFSLFLFSLHLEAIHTQDRSSPTIPRQSPKS